MYPDQDFETIKKERAFREAYAGLAAAAGEATYLADVANEASIGRRPERDCLRDRVAIESNRSMREARRASDLDELLFLLDKNPDVARILDLVQSTGV